MSSRREPPRRHREWKPERALRRARIDWRQVALVIAIAAALGLALAIVLVAAFVPPVHA